MPLAATVTLDLFFPPVEVKILGRNAALSEGERYSLVCEAGGSRPPADLSWYLDGLLMTDTKDQVLQEGNVSRSTLHLVPNRLHHGAVLSCRADNSKLPAAALEDSRKLMVYYAPKLQLRAGQSLAMTNIKEGDDVYFECKIHANPSVFRVQWFLNGIESQQNFTAGVIQSNQSLVLQKVGRGSSGLYTCRAVNMQGSDSSNAIQLNVKYAPVCAGGQKWVYGGGRQQPINVTCRVEAHPEATEFRWAFNTSSEYVQIPQDRIHSSRGRSMVAYTPQTHHDFGSLLCWGVNDVDTQELPCVYHIVPAGVPEAVHNCSAWHNTSRAGEVVVACHEGWGGGLSQTFTLEVREAIPQGPSSSGTSPPLGKILAALRHQSAPHFTVTGLAPGTEYHLAVVASNAQGDAKPTVLVHLTPIDVAEKRMSATTPGSSGSVQLVLLSPIVGVVVGVVASLLVCSAVVVVIVRARCAARGRHTHTKIVYDENKGDGRDPLHQQQPGPDIILVKDVKAAEVEKEVMRDYRNSPDGSFYINPGSLLSNGVLVTRETDALLQDPSVRSVVGGGIPNTTTSFHLPHLPPPPTTTAATSSDPTITLSIGRTSFQHPTICRSPPGPQHCPQDLYLQKLNCDQSRPTSFQHPVAPRDPLMSFTSMGRGASPSLTSPVSHLSPSVPQKCPQDLYLHKLECDAARHLLVTPSQCEGTNHESSV
ncbi:neural cell adhesion molecule 1-A-like [Homarus americanus]|uniref:neural cell adhesion molecule 1-A-like n=1 Tax=Homarus americanus TaxID=6706 RepID=UPI001C47314A|nr:neural cell adhesion molecule 1-A-like [Homarus americanus]